ncbi:AAA domain-containing protein [Plantactinospora mayteni]|uniref:AAA domain-containing protein n=1 Tax=Plantactinospora mayteni TaxID=566021 RepID=UPI001EF5B6A3|nr:AAA domain-containing protein [Plantactinospora mayteni]
MQRLWWRLGVVLPDWRDEVCAAVNLWISAEGRSGRAGWVCVGPARAEGERGWYSVDTRGSRTDPDQIDNLRISGSREPGADDGYPLLEVLQEGQLLRVRVPEFVDIADAHLWQYKQSATHLLTKLCEGLAAVADASLAHDLAAGRLAPKPRHVADIAGFTPAQREAYDSCFTRGVRLIWGPPGTGKTRVLSEAIADLVTAGKRVLLASSTNIAVDNALAGVVRHRRHRPGDLVRVGTPHLRQIAEDPAVSLTHLASSRLAEVKQRRQALEQRLVTMRDTLDELATLEDLVTGFDPDEYARARKLIDEADRIPQLAARLDTAGKHVHACREEADRAAAAATTARAALGETARSRTALDEIDRLHKEAAAAADAVDRTGAQLLARRDERNRINDELRAAEAATGMTRLRNRRTVKRLQVELGTAEHGVAELEQRERSDRELVERFRRAVDTQTAALSTRVSFTREQITARETMAAAAQRTHAASAGRLADALTGQENLQKSLLAAEGAPRLTDQQRALVDRVERRDLLVKHRSVLSLRARVAAEAPARAQLEREHAKVQDEFDKLRRDAEGEIIRNARAVATTLARLRTAKVLLDGPYDVVLIDEVGAATVPEALLAVSRARSTAVLLGDFMQLGPVLPKAVKEIDRPDVRRWLNTDVFELCGITTAAHARAHPGCTALDEQHRFGHDVMGLANAIAYDGLLTAGPGIRPRDSNEDPEIVLIDTDGLGDLATVRSTGATKGWWPAGALLSRALADYHHARSEDVGVVTPYSDQAEATLEALRDQENSDTLPTEVGTAHRFQGREFDIVVFDLVEDHLGRRWMAQATLDGTSFTREGVRLFNVAVTRTKNRLYLIGSRTRISTAKPGTPFAHLRRLLGSTIRTVSARSLITAPSVPEPDRPLLGPFGSELADLLAQQVTVTDIQDERQFYVTFAEHLRSARRTIWIWATWTATRMQKVLPELEVAVKRGVTVVVFVRDPTDHQQGKAQSQQYLAALRATVQRVVEIHEMHQKIVVIDEHTVLLGSLNVLSQKQSREVMLVMKGSHFARKLLEHERANDLAAPPPRCGKCGSVMVDLRLYVKDGWHWRCYAPAPTSPADSRSKTCGWRQKVPARGRRSGTLRT